MKTKTFKKIINFLRNCNIPSMFYMPIIIGILTKSKDAACIGVFWPFFFEAVVIRPIEDDYYYNNQGGENKQ